MGMLESVSQNSTTGKVRHLGSKKVSPGSIATSRWTCSPTTLSSKVAKTEKRNRNARGSNNDNAYGRSSAPVRPALGMTPDKSRAILTRETTTQNAHSVRATVRTTAPSCEDTSSTQDHMASEPSDRRHALLTGPCAISISSGSNLALCLEGTCVISMTHAPQRSGHRRSAAFCSTNSLRLSTLKNALPVGSSLPFGAQRATLMGGNGLSRRWSNPSSISGWAVRYRSTSRLSARSSSASGTSSCSGSSSLLSSLSSSSALGEPSAAGEAAVASVEVTVASSD
mmetsp:Transcript_50606/g.114937  ORF Transcript_50606/g.114937 Transcript_50606/m.114937 type:complete len:283 (+) Transcript_50606:225-1073(+)